MMAIRVVIKRIVDGDIVDVDGGVFESMKLAVEHANKAIRDKKNVSWYWEEVKDGVDSTGDNKGSEPDSEMA